MRSKRLTALEQRWANALAPYNFDIKYRPGHRNVNADILSTIEHNPDESLFSQETESYLDEVTATTRLSPELRLMAAQEAMTALEDRQDSLGGETPATTLPSISTENMAEMQRQDPTIGRVN